MLFIVLDTSSATVELTPQIQVSVENRKSEYNLRGIVDYSDLHFTTRIFTDDSVVMYYDGIGTAGEFVEDSTVDISCSQQLQKCGAQKAALAIYSSI